MRSPAFQSWYAGSADASCHCDSLACRRFQTSLAAADLAFLLDHIVQQTSILPGTGMLEVCNVRCFCAARLSGMASICGGGGGGGARCGGGARAGGGGGGGGGGVVVHVRGAHARFCRWPACGKRATYVQAICMPGQGVLAQGCRYIPQLFVLVLAVAALSLETLPWAAGCALWAAPSQLLWYCSSHIPVQLKVLASAMQQRFLQ